MWKVLHKLKDIVFYDAERQFYAKLFPGSVQIKDVLKMRKMDHADLPEVLAIEEQNYEFPWPEGIFKDCMRTMTYTNWVCLAPDDRVIGYCIISVAAGEAHVMNISVCPKFRRQGVGRHMLLHLIQFARPRAESLFLEVRPSNPHAIELYKQSGFRQIGVRKDYYPASEGREDAIMFSLNLSADD